MPSLTQGLRIEGGIGLIRREVEESPDFVEARASMTSRFSATSPVPWGVPSVARSASCSSAFCT